jgi:hypothetical protein
MSIALEHYSKHPRDCYVSIGICVSNAEHDARPHSTWLVNLNEK